MALIFAILSLITFVTIKYLPINTDNYNYVHVIKMQRLDTLPSPRLIFIGGSNIAFGINSERISDSLNINVQNAAVHAGIGFRFMLDEISDRVKKGDIIVAMPEYSQFYLQYNGDDAGTLTDVVFYNEHNVWPKLNTQQLLNVISGFTTHIKGRKKIDIEKAERTKGYVYSPRNFNIYGDETAHRAQKPKLLAIKKYSQTQIDMDIISEISDKVRGLEAKGAKVLFFWPITIHSNYEAHKEIIHKITIALGSHGISYATTPDYLVEPDSLAYDTPYHMSGSAVDDVTDKLIFRLTSILHGNSSDPKQVEN